MTKAILFIFSLLTLQCGLAAELFGLPLRSSTLDQMRTAVKQAGATLILESGGGRPYDIYDSRKLLSGSSRLYLGHVGEDQRLAFVEYEFVGLKRPLMLQMLSDKYGKPNTQTGKFISDQGYHWVENGVGIILRSDWQNYRTLLSYIAPEALAELKKANQIVKADEIDSNTSNY